MTREKGKANEVHGAIKSLPDQIAEVLWAIVGAFLGIGGTLEDLAALASKAASAKRGQVARYMLDIARGTQTLVMEEALKLFLAVGIISEVTDIVAPKGGKVFRLLVPVNWAMAWKEFQLRCCPQTDPNNAVLNVGEQFASTFMGITFVEIILVWFGKGSYTTGAQALEWAKPYESQLEAAHGRIPAAIIGYVQGIVAQLKPLGFCYDSVGIVTPSEFKLGEARRFPYAWRYGGGGRGADWYDVGYGWGDYCLFAFSRKPLVS